MVRKSPKIYIYLLTEYIKSVLWGLSVRLSSMSDAWCLKVKKWLDESRAALDATAQREIPVSAAKRNARTQPVLWSLQTYVLRLMPLL